MNSRWRIIFLIIIPVAIIGTFLIPFEKKEVLDFMALQGSRRIPLKNIVKEYFVSDKKKVVSKQEKKQVLSFLETEVAKINTKKFKVKFKVSEAAAICSYPIKKRFSKYNLDLPTKGYKDSLFAYRNDWQTFQLVIVPFTDDDLVINSCSVKDKGEVVEIFKGEYVFCEPSVYSPEQKGWVLDPLLPFDNTDSLIIQPNQNRCLFFNYFVPEEYEKDRKYFHIVLETNRGPIKYDLSVEVRQKTIPNQISLKTAFSFDINWVNWFYADSTLVWDNAKYYYDFLLKHKISPTFIYKNDRQKTWPLFRDWKYCIDKGGNFFFADYYQGYNPKTRMDTLSMIESIAGNIKTVDSLGLRNYTGIYLFDELRRASQYQIIIADSLLKDINVPKLPLITTAPFTKIYEDYLDVWCPKLDDYAFFETNSTKDSSWLYICNTTTDSFPNFLLEYPLSDIDSLFSFMKKKPINGFLYWSLNCWRNNIYNPVKGNKYFDPKLWITDSYQMHNGDGMLIYPWKNGQLIPSIRLLNIRDQLELWDMN